MKNYWQQIVSIILCSLGILNLILLATVTDYLEVFKDVMSANSFMEESAHFSVLRTDSVVTDYVIINPVVEVPCDEN